MTQATKLNISTDQRRRAKKLSGETRRIMMVVIIFAIGAALARRFVGEYAVDWVVIASHFVAPYVHSASKTIEG